MLMPITSDRCFSHYTLQKHQNMFRIHIHSFCGMEPSKYFHNVHMQWSQIEAIDKDCQLDANIDVTYLDADITPSILYISHCKIAYPRSIDQTQNQTEPK